MAAVRTSTKILGAICAMPFIISLIVVMNGGYRGYYALFDDYSLRQRGLIR